MQRPARRRRTQTQSARRSPSAAPYRLSGASTGSRGAPEDPAPERTAASSLNTSTVLLRPKKTFAPAAARADLPRDTATVQPDDLIEVEFDNGERLWMRGDDFRINFAQVVVGRDAGGEEVEVPLTLADRLARSRNARSRGVGDQGPEGVWCRSCRRVRQGDRAPGRLSGCAVEEAADTRPVVSVQYRHGGLRPHRDRSHRRHQRWAMAVVSARYALEHVGQFRRALVEGPRHAADGSSHRLRQPHHRVRAHHADGEPGSERARSRRASSPASHAPRGQPLAWRPGR